MEKPIKVKRKFRKSIVNLLVQAQTMLDHVIIDLLLFTAKFPFIDAAYVAAWQTAIDNADDAPDDEQVLDDQQMVTYNMSVAMNDARNLYTLLIIYVKLAYPGNDAVLEHFGLKRYRKDRSVQEGMKELMDIAYTRANSTDYKAALIAKGFTQVMIDSVLASANSLDTINLNQENTKLDRFVLTRNRNLMLNEVWDYMTQVNMVAPAVFPGNYEKQRLFMLYPEKQNTPAPNVSISGILRDNVTNNPIVEAMLTIGNKSALTDVDGAFEINFYISEPTTYNVTITKTGYQTVNTTVQFAPDVNIVQDLEMTPETAVATGSITGTVTDSATNLGLGGVLVQSDSGGTTVITNAGGNYTLTDLPVGNRTITYSKTGYVSNQQVVNVTEDGTAIMNVSLVPQP